MKKEYYIQAANVVKEMAIDQKKRTTMIEKEAQSLFFWILNFFELEIRYAKLWNYNENKYKLEIKNYKIGNKYNKDRFLCRSQRYSSFFVHDEEFEKVIKKVVNIFNSIKGYKAEYFDFAEYGDTMLRITLNVEDLK